MSAETLRRAANQIRKQYGGFVESDEQTFYLAVADWLDVFDGVPNIRDDHPALKVARAYLGESA